MEITIREARLEDSSAIAAIHRALGWSEHFNGESFSEIQAEMEERLARCVKEQTHTILVALKSDSAREERVVGYVSVHWYPHLLRGSDGYVSELFVHPSETGQGIGGQLLATIEDYARERGCERLLLMNRRIRESYTRKFYAKHGWEELSDAAFFSLSLSTASS
ncbi:GNAT family N-acetyltransferase [Dictyobacter arantiisoli]|uniref:N-acetyltransferase domain-containing protein n=1 Tax=Dictyobacter arantiisoli TaxID=2014874 RepID=A0A5A5THP0_9CHLR|nr:GNAT family N-acetyltransferase [Dictyobacter arantiisoli]GCF11100.1 hypothetical protein KDI_46640 [Dictyobacter arantiisoli]